MKQKINFEKIVKFSMPYDKRSDEPGKNYGIGAMRIWFILKGRHGAVQVLIGTQFYLPATINEYIEKGRNIMKTHDGKDQEPFDCWDVGYHSPKPFFEGQTKQECDILKKGYCYYDGSSLRGKHDGVDKMFMEKGQDAIWEYLEKEYRDLYLMEDKNDDKKS